MPSRYGSMSDSGHRQQYNHSGRHGTKPNDKSPLLSDNYAKTDIDDLPSSSRGSIDLLLPHGRFSSYRQLSHELKRLRFVCFIRELLFRSCRILQIYCVLIFFVDKERKWLRINSAGLMLKDVVISDRTVTFMHPRRRRWRSWHILARTAKTMAI